MITKNTFKEEEYYSEDINEEDFNDEIKTNSCFDDLAGEKTLPDGWIIKGKGSFASVRSPHGKFYKSRRQAFADMINSGIYTFSEAEEMKSMLKFEGWKENKGLPDGWLIKERHNHKLFLGRGGEIFQSFLQASVFVEKYKQYFSQNDVDKFDKMKQLTSPTVRKKPDKSWIKDDPSVPKGWLLKVTHSGQQISERLRTPEGACFKGRRQALRYLTQKKCPYKEIELMRNSLMKRGWSKDASLPGDWLYKKTSKHCRFIDQEGNGYESKGVVIKHLNSMNMSNKVAMIENFTHTT